MSGPQHLTSQGVVETRGPALATSGQTIRQRLKGPWELPPQPPPPPGGPSLMSWNVQQQGSIQNDCLIPAFLAVHGGGKETPKALTGLANPAQGSIRHAAGAGLQELATK